MKALKQISAAMYLLSGMCLGQTFRLGFDSDKYWFLWGTFGVVFLIFATASNLEDKSP